MSTRPSRKLWVAIVGFIAPLLYARGASEEMVIQVAALIMSGASVIAYIFGQAWCDAKKEEYAYGVLCEEESIEWDEQSS